MRIALLTLALAACATMEPEAPASAAEDACGAARVADLVGRTRSDSLVAEVARLTGAEQIRWLRPGDAVTMDYRADRLNVHLDGRDRIERFACG